MQSEASKVFPKFQPTFILLASSGPEICAKSELSGLGAIVVFEELSAELSELLSSEFSGESLSEELSTLEKLSVSSKPELEDDEKLDELCVASAEISAF